MVKAHRWIALLLGLWIVLESLTGSSIVFAGEIDRMWNRDEFSSTQGDVGLERALEAARDARPDDLLRFAVVPSGDTGGMYEVWLSDQRADYHEVLVDPGTGTVTSADHQPPWLLGLLERLHFNLNSTSIFGLDPMTVIGWLAIGWLVVLLTGFYVWYWPGVKRWARALRVRTHRGRFTFNLDLHKAVGIVAFVPLTLVTVTGINFAFPEQVRAVWNAVTLGTLDDSQAQVPLSVPSAGPTLSAEDAEEIVAGLDDSIEVTSVVSPGGSPVGTWTVDAEVDASWLGMVGGTREVEFAVDQYDGRIVAVEDSVDQTLSTRLYEQWAHEVHFGTFAGLTSKVLWVLLGLSPVVLAVTGLVMWTGRRSKRSRRPPVDTDSSAAPPVAAPPSR